jgi:hypothetical protein
MRPTALYREQELAFRTQYAELKERALASGSLLPGTPGTLTLRRGTGHSYWYRVFYPVPGRQAEELVGKEDDAGAVADMGSRIQFGDWVATQVASLRKLGFQVGDKLVARVLVELHNKGAFDAGLVLVGTLGFMAWLNELGAIVAANRTQDIDMAENLGAVVKLPELDWAAQTVPYYDYLLESPEPGAMLAGGHCVPVRLPQAARLVWHKLYASLHRQGFPEKATKDRQQALILAAVLADAEPGALPDAYRAMPAAMAGEVGPLAAALAEHAGAYPVLQEALRRCASC